MEKKTYPEGHWMGIGIAIGMIIGLASFVLWIVFLEDVTMGIIFGPSMGIAIGVSIGVALEQQHKDQIRPLTDKEKKTRRTMVTLGIFSLIVGVIVFLVMLIL